MRERKESIELQFLRVWSRLEKHWGSFLTKAGLNLAGLSRSNVRELLTARIRIDRNLPGLEDSSPCCRRGVTPGDPALSLLYYVLASPHVSPVGINPADYPTILYLEIVENVIYAATDMTLAKLHRLARGRELAVAIFAFEYSPAEHTVHGRHADLCFSRTEVSRGQIRASNFEPRPGVNRRGSFKRATSLSRDGIHRRMRPPVRAKARRPPFSPITGWDRLSRKTPCFVRRWAPFGLDNPFLRAQCQSHHYANDRCGSGLE